MLIQSTTRTPLHAWKLHGVGHGDQSTEYLTPRLEQDESLAEFPFLLRRPTMDAATMQAQISALAPWTYHVEAGGATTRGHGTYNDDTITFHRYRTNLISAAVLAMLGPAAKDARMLDLGCNCGFFTLDLAERGVGSVLGLDFRPENLAQAEFLKTAFGIENASFGRENVKDLGGRTFDVVLNLGLMYHLSTPFEVMRACYDATERFCVVDTITHHEPFSAYHVNVANTESPIEGDLSFELQPTYRGILDTISAAGFGEVIEITAPTNTQLYNNASRRCLVAFKDRADGYIERLVNWADQGVGSIRSKAE